MSAVWQVRGKELPAVEDAEPIVVDAVEFEKSLNTSVASYDLKGRQARKSAVHLSLLNQPDASVH